MPKQNITANIVARCWMQFTFSEIEDVLESEDMKEVVEKLYLTEPKVQQGIRFSFDKIAKSLFNEKGLIGRECNASLKASLLNMVEVVSHLAVLNEHGIALPWTCFDDVFNMLKGFIFFLSVSNLHYRESLVKAFLEYASDDCVFHVDMTRIPDEEFLEYFQTAYSAVEGFDEWKKQEKSHFVCGNIFVEGPDGEMITPLSAVIKSDEAFANKILPNVFTSDKFSTKMPLLGEAEHFLGNHFMMLRKSSAKSTVGKLFVTLVDSFFVLPIDEKNMLLFTALVEQIARSLTTLFVKKTKIPNDLTVSPLVFNLLCSILNKPTIVPNSVLPYIITIIHFIIDFVPSAMKSVTPDQLNILIQVIANLIENHDTMKLDQSSAKCLIAMSGLLLQKLAAPVDRLTKVLGQLPSDLQAFPATAYILNMFNDEAKLEVAPVPRKEVNPLAEAALNLEGGPRIPGTTSSKQAVENRFLKTFAEEDGVRNARAAQADRFRPSGFPVVYGGGTRGEMGALDDISENGDASFKYVQGAVVPNLEENNTTIIVPPLKAIEDIQSHTIQITVSALFNSGKAGVCYIGLFKDNKSRARGPFPQAALLAPPENEVLYTNPNFKSFEIFDPEKVSSQFVAQGVIMTSNLRDGIERQFIRDVESLTNGAILKNKVKVYFKEVGKRVFTPDGEIKFQRIPQCFVVEIHTEAIENCVVSTAWSKVFRRSGPFMVYWSFRSIYLDIALKHEKSILKKLAVSKILMARGDEEGDGDEHVPKW